MNKGVGTRQRHIAPERRAVNPYAHEDAMDLLLGRDTAAIGRALGLARRTVGQWSERHDAEHRGPGRTLAIAIREALAIGRPASDCADVVRAILEDAGLPYTLAPLVAFEGTIGARDVDHAAITAVREMAEAASRASDLCRNGLTPAERFEVKRELREAIEAAMAFDSVLDQMPSEVAS